MTWDNNRLNAYVDQQIALGKNTKALLGFVDLLGFRNEILKNWGDPDKDPLRRLLKLKAYAKQTAEDEGFHKFQDYDGKEILRIPYAKVLTFSDSFIFILPVEGESPEYKLGCILSITGSMIELWRKCIDEEFTVRGAVDFGEIFYNNEDLIGPSLIKAYDGEYKTAITSRIIFTSDAIKIISENLPHSNSIINQYFKRYLVDDVDSLIILNPVILYGYEEKALPNITNAIAKLKIMRSNVQDFHLKAKYDSLIARLNAKIDPNNEFEIYSRY